MSRPKDALRDAATVILLRSEGAGTQVLMGQRGRGAAFMPDKFVFPGGAVDEADRAVAAEAVRDPETLARLAIRTPEDVARALPLTAIRELWEETGLRLAIADARAREEAVPEAWRGFFAAGLRPNVGPLRLVFRAITPPGRPRRFDARFFVVRAVELHDPVDDHQSLDGELRHLQWIDLARARDLPLPFITEVVLSEVEALVAAPDVPRKVPFFDNTAEASHFHLL